MFIGISNNSNNECSSSNNDDSNFISLFNESTLYLLLKYTKFLDEVLFNDFSFNLFYYNTISSYYLHVLVSNCNYDW